MLNPLVAEVSVIERAAAAHADAGVVCVLEFAVHDG